MLKPSVRELASGKWAVLDFPRKHDGTIRSTKSLVCLEIVPTEGEARGHLAQNQEVATS
jgi:hypothetical protein